MDHRTKGGGNDALDVPPPPKYSIYDVVVLQLLPISNKCTYYTTRAIMSHDTKKRKQISIWWFHTLRVPTFLPTSPGRILCVVSSSLNTLYTQDKIHINIRIETAVVGRHFNIWNSFTIIIIIIISLDYHVCTPFDARDNKYHRLLLLSRRLYCLSGGTTQYDANA